MRTATKEFTFDAAHMLSGHLGLCKNLHGHTYRVEVTVKHIPGADVMPHGPAEGMIMDFKDLKETLNTDIFSNLDHAYIYNSMDYNKDPIAELCKSLDMKVYDMAMRPTAENMAEYFLAMSNTSLRDFPVEVVSVRVWETPTSYAESYNEEVIECK